MWRASVPPVTEAAKLLFKSFQLTRPQKSELLAAWQDEPEAVEQIARECAVYGHERGNSGAGLLLSRLRRGDHYPAMFTQPMASEAVTPRLKLTGWRAVRGSHGSTFVADQLGTDRPPKEWGSG